MRCPYCEGKMRKGQLHAVGVGAGLEWKEGSESLRLNTDPELAARISGDRIAAYNLSLIHILWVFIFKCFCQEQNYM